MNWQAAYRSNKMGDYTLKYKQSSFEIHSHWVFLSSYIRLQFLGGIAFRYLYC